MNSFAGKKANQSLSALAESKKITETKTIEKFSPPSHQRIAKTKIIASDDAGGDIGTGGGW